MKALIMNLQEKNSTGLTVLSQQGAFTNFKGFHAGHNWSRYFLPTAL